jgi:hypothetical protein
MNYGMSMWTGLTVSGCGLLVGSCENGNEQSCYMYDGIFLYLLGDYFLAVLNPAILFLSDYNIGKNDSGL